MLNDDNKPGGSRRGGKRDYEVGYGKPPVHTRFQKGNPGRRKGSGKKPLEFSEKLSRSLSKPMKVRQGDRIIEKEMPELIAERLKTMALKGSARDLEVLLRILAQRAPELLKLPESELHVVYHQAEGSTIASPPAHLFKRDRS